MSTIREERPGSVSKQVKSRLPRYYRYLKELLNLGIYRISSRALADMMNVTASQIRQDLNCFGGFGQQGYGYNVKYLYSQISEILGVNEKFKAILVGVGNLGKAVASSGMFASRGIDLVALFDVSPDIVGKTVAGKAVRDSATLSEFLKENRVELAVLTLTPPAALQVAEELKSMGIRGIWNFTDVELPADESISVMNVHMADGLMQLCFDVRNRRIDG